MDDAKKFKEAEIRSQQETIRLMEKQEQDRNDEVKRRELRSKKPYGYHGTNCY